MSRKCPCGSEPNSSAPPHVVIKLADIWGVFNNWRGKTNRVLDGIENRERIIARGLRNKLEARLRETGQVLPEILRDELLTQDLASAALAQGIDFPAGGLGVAGAWDITTFCQSPAEAHYSYTGYSWPVVGPVFDKIFNDYVDAYWGRYCRCRRCEPPPDCFPPFRGGQCPGMLYTVKFTVRSIQEDGSLDPTVYTPTYQVPGPIGPATFEWTSPSTFGGCRNYYFRYRWTHGPTSANPQGISFVSMGGSNVRVGHNPFTSSCYGGQASWIIVQQEVFPPPGTIDSCGDPPLPPHCFQPAPPPPPPRPPRVRYPIPFCECPPPPPPVRVVKLLPGPPGPKGPKGDKGDRGPRGFKGEKGAKGDKGDRGLRGLKGEKGDRGAKGETGRRGPLGYQGPKGDKGEKGAKGDRGFRGPTGAKGPKGDKGDKGDAGLTAIRTSLYLIPANSDEKSSFTVSKSGSIFTLKLRLKMSGENSKLIERIYRILGGDRWFDDPNDTSPALTIRPESDIRNKRAIAFPTGQEINQEVFNSDLPQLITTLLAALYHRSGGHRFPATVPESLADTSSSTKSIADAASWQEWLVLQLDALHGAYPVKVKYKGADNQEQTLEIANSAEALAEIVGLLISINADTDILQAMSMKTIVEAIGARMAATTASDYGKANAEFLGYKSREKSKDIKIAVNPGAKNLRSALQESTKKISRFEFDDDTDFQDLVRRLLLGVEIVKAAFYRPYNPGDKLPGERIRDDRGEDGQDEEWNKFVSEINNPTGNRRDPKAPTPKLRNLAGEAPEGQQPQ